MEMKVRKTETTGLAWYSFSLPATRTHLPFVTICFSGNDALAFDGVDFDEPMEVGLEEEKPAIKDDAETKAAAAPVKVEPKAEPQDPVLL